MRKSVAIVAAVAALAPVAAVPAFAGAAPASLVTSRHFEGTVVSVDRGARTFRLRDAQRGTARIAVTRATRFHRISGLSGLRAGLTGVEATVRRSNGRWVATLVERSGGGGRHGGKDD